jgi:hypothetical protein
MKDGREGGREGQREGRRKRGREGERERRNRREKNQKHRLTWLFFGACHLHSHIFNLSFKV